MKTLILLFTIFSMNIAMAGQDTGGGDPCENRIKEIAQDIKSWINNGGAKDLKLPEAVTLDTYTKGMITEINGTSVQCVGKNDPGYPVLVDGTPKVCAFDRKGNSSKIACDSEKLRVQSDNDQYMLIHHEYAGLAGFENPIGPNSNYDISKQITNYLEHNWVKKLVVKNYAAEEEDKKLSLRIFWIIKSSYNTVFLRDDATGVTRLRDEELNDLKFKWAIGRGLTKLFPNVTFEQVNKCYFVETDAYFKENTLNGKFQQQYYDIGDLYRAIKTNVVPCIKKLNQ